MAGKSYSFGNAQGQRRIREESFVPEQQYVQPQSSRASGGRRPVWEGKAQGIQVAVWENSQQRQDGQAYTTRSVTVQRRYKDAKSGEWKSTSSFDARHVAALRLLLAGAEEFLVFGEKAAHGAEEAEE